MKPYRQYVNGVKDSRYTHVPQGPDEATFPEGLATAPVTPKPQNPNLS